MLAAALLALLKRRGIAAEQATIDQYADAAEISAEIVASGKETVADLLAVAAPPADVGQPDELTTDVLARFAMDGKFIRDVSITEQELLEAAVAAEQARMEAFGVPTRASRDPVERARAEQRKGETIVAEASTRDGYCPTCGYHLRDYGCQCA